MPELSLKTVLLQGVSLGFCESCDRADQKARTRLRRGSMGQAED